MVTNRKATGRAISMPVGLLWGTLGSLLISSAGIGFTGYIIYCGAVPEQSYGYAAMIIIFLSALTGALMSVRKIKRRRTLVCFLSGALYYGFLLGTTALLFKGEYQGTFVTGLLILSASGTVAILGNRKNKNKKFKYAVNDIRQFKQK